MFETSAALMPDSGTKTFFGAGVFARDTAVPCVNDATQSSALMSDEHHMLS